MVSTPFFGPTPETAEDTIDFVVSILGKYCIIYADLPWTAMIAMPLSTTRQDCDVRRKFWFFVVLLMGASGHYPYSLFTLTHGFLGVSPPFCEGSPNVCVPVACLGRMPIRRL